MSQKGLPVRQAGLAPLLIVLLIALVVGGYLIYQNQNKPVSVLPSPSPITSPVASNSTETTNWKIYTSPLYNPFYTADELKAEITRRKSNGEDPNKIPSLQEVRFSIKLPADWQPGYNQQGLNGENDTFGSGYTFTHQNLEIRIGRFYAPGGNSCNGDFVGYGANYKDIHTPSFTLRRTKEFVNNSYIPKGYIRFAICAGDEKDLYTNSVLGVISFTLPNSYNPADLDLMDQIISTLKNI